MSQFINLYNPSLRQRQDSLNAHLLFRLIGWAVCSMVLLTGWLEWQAHGFEQQARVGAEHMKQAQEELVVITRTVSEYQPDARLIGEMQRAERILKGRNELVRLMESGTLGRTQGFSAQMRAFARQSLDGLWLTRVHLNADGSEMEIAGRALKAELLPVYIHRLNSEQIFQGQNFAALNVKDLSEESATGGDAKNVVKPENSVVSESTTIAFSLSAKIRMGEMERP